MANVEVGGKHRLQCRPIEARRLHTCRIIGADLSARGLDRQRPNAVAAADQAEMENCVLGSEFDLSGGALLAGDPDALDGNRPQKRCGDFGDFDFQMLAMGLPVQPKTEPVRDNEGGKDDRAQRHHQNGERDQQQTVFRHRR